MFKLCLNCIHFFLHFSSLIKDHWNDKISVAKNLSNFGLSNDPSKSILTGYTDTQPKVPNEEVKAPKKRVFFIIFQGFIEYLLKCIFF